MKIRYQTGTATLIQLVVMLILNFVNGVQSTVSACVQRNGCVSNIAVTGMFIIALAIWLIFLSALGYTAQDKRSRRLASLLMACEGLVAIVTLFDIKHFPNALGLITSIIDCALAVWIIVLAYRLRQANGGRVVAVNHDRPRRRLSR